jgi:micrococcal nuclease
VDADTYAVEIQVRAQYVDAPELKQPHGTKAAEFASDLLLGQEITFRPYYRSYKRAVSDVRIGKDDVAMLLVERGHVWLDPRYKPPKLLTDAQRDARAMRKGLWRLPDRDRVPPWEWRRPSNARIP